MNPELIAAVKERIALDHTDEMIREELRGTGYTEDVIEQVIKESHLTPIPVAINEERIDLPKISVLISGGWSFTKRYRTIALLLAVPLVSFEIVLYFTKNLTDPVISVIAGVIGILAFLGYLFLVVATLRMVISDDGSRIIPFQEVSGWTKANVLGLVWVIILNTMVIWGGFILFIIPGIVVSLLLYFSQYVYVIEGRRGMDALLRSRELVRGHWWALAARLSQMILVFLGAFLILGVLAGVIDAFIGEVGEKKVFWDLVMNLVFQVISAFVTVLGLWIGTELYRTLAQKRPAADVAFTEARGKYIALAWLGIVFTLLVISAQTTHNSIGDEVRDNFQKEIIDRDAKIRAIELRNSQG